MRVLLALIIGIAIGGSAVWYLSTNQGKTRAQATSTQVQNAARSAADAVQEKLRVLDLRPQDVKDELARTGQVVRRKARDAGKVLADATADARTTGAIKAKLLADRELSAWSISVNTTSGIVTLSGTVPSTEAISRAMLLAMDTDGVREVISTLQVKPRNDKGAGSAAFRLQKHPTQTARSAFLSDLRVYGPPCSLKAALRRRD